jgi:Arc/MetJ-type ribon-helix-helix transcriptional regulator
MNTTYDSYEEKVSVNLFSDVLLRITEAVNNDRNRFPDRSTFIRVAIMKLLREVEEK